MSNPFNSHPPQGEPQEPGPDRAATPPNYEAYRYPSGGADATPAPTPVPPTDPGYAGYGGYGSAGGSDAASTWAVDERKNGVAGWALGVGILSLLVAVSVVATAFAVIFGLVGLIIGIIALVRGRRINGPGRRTGMAVTGLVLSLIAIGLSVIFWVLMAVVLSDTGMMDCISISDPTERQQCVERAIDTWLNQ